MMESISASAKSARNCLMCSARCREPTPLLKYEVVGAVHNNHLQRQLQHLFIIRQLLEIPAQWCELTLQRFDGKYDPSKWFRICQNCIPKVDRAWNIYQQLLSLESEMKAIKEQIKYKMQRNFEKSKGIKGIDYEICSLLFPALAEERRFFDLNQNSAENVADKADGAGMFQADSFFGTEDSQIDEFFDCYHSDDEDSHPPPTKRKKRTKEKKVTDGGNSSIASRKNWCTLCPAKLINEEELEAHMKVHEESQRNGRPFECQHCSFPATSSEQLETHILEFHVKSNVSIRTHACPYCKFSAKAWKLLKIHVDEQHSSETSGSGGFELRCVPCDKLFECRSSFLVHQKKMHPENFGFAKEEISCDQCSRKFPSRLHLEYHIRNTHDRVTNFVCEICAKGFRTAVALNRHKVTHQENKRQHICHLCGCDYSYGSILVDHYKKVHPGSISSDGKIDPSATDTAESGKEFRCKYCEVTSPYKLVMLRHMETHKAEMGHKCDICQKCYTNAGGLKRHMRINHPATSQGVNCPYCFKNFASPDYMKSHINKYCKVKTLAETQNSEPEVQQVEVQVEDTN